MRFIGVAEEPTTLVVEGVAATVASAAPRIVAATRARGSRWLLRPRLHASLGACVVHVNVLGARAVASAGEVRATSVRATLGELLGATALTLFAPERPQ